MERRDVLVAHCIRCSLSIAATGGIETLTAIGWVTVEEAEPPRKDALPMLCPTCAEKERDPARKQ